MRLVLALLVLSLAASPSQSESLDELPLASPVRLAKTDWLMGGATYTARVYRTGKAGEIALDNGLVRRTFRLTPNAATVGLDNLMTGEAVLRGVKPEAVLKIDGRRYEVGGLVGQPNYAYLTPEWLEEMQANPTAMRFVGFEVGLPLERLHWKRVRHHAPGAVWPPRGVHLRMDYEMPVDAGRQADPSQLRSVLWIDDFDQLDRDWTAHVSDMHQRASIENEGKPGEIYTLSSAYCFVERTLPKDVGLVDVTIHPGTDRGVSWGPGLALVYDQRVIRLALRLGDRGEHGHFELRDNGRESLQSVEAFASPDGGLNTEAAYHLRVRVLDGKLLWEAARDIGEQPQYHTLFTVAVSTSEHPKAPRVGKMGRHGGATVDAAFPGELGRCRIERVAVYGPPDPSRMAEVSATCEVSQAVRVTVHYEMYDGVPVMSKWITVQNRTEAEITVDEFTSEMLAVVEHANWVEEREGVAIPTPQVLHVETDFAFGGFNHRNANRHIVHWRPDPQFTSQVNYLRRTPCLLVVEPTYGPAQTVAPEAIFESCRVFELLYDSSDRERRGLALRRMYRTIAPWITENPLMHHLLNAHPDAAKQAIDQAAEVGFEMIILSFGSGFNMDNEAPEYLATWKDVADYAESRGIEIGSYSLLSSRNAPTSNMIVSPEGQRPTHGRCPALTSKWGQAYMHRMRSFFEKTGFDLLEHDGSYPGDVDVTPRPPLQSGEQDSRWVQWRIISDYYRWCRGRGIYLNVPDYYFLNGSNKCGMGYREVNWSLPRSMQLIHTRQNIYDGTWTKAPSMGWMFVPLSQYHGGGAAATVEPLDTHLDHYRRMFDSNLAFGVQACYRGPRLFDTDRTKRMVKQRVEWFKEYRDILESDVIHGRRSDGRDLDWMLHVNPRLKHKGMLVVFNPLNEPVTKTLRVGLYYTGLTENVRVRQEGGEPEGMILGRDYSIELPVEVAANEMTWFLME